MKSLQQIEGNPLVRCSCGRMANTDMMRVSENGFACDSCHDRMFKSGSVTAENFARSQKAPALVVAKAQLLDVARTARAEELATRV